MTATPSIELPAWMAEQLSQASPDLLRQMVQIMTLVRVRVRARAPTRCVRIGVADQVKKILGTGGARRRRRREGQRGAQRSEDTSS
jgi:cell division protein FtsB